jgi:transposase InsO family protein
VASTPSRSASGVRPASKPTIGITPSWSGRRMRGVPIKSASKSFYRVLRKADQLHHRGKAQAPRRLSKPKSYAASAPHQVWNGDITSLTTTVLGVFFRLYLVMDIYSRKIIALVTAGSLYQRRCTTFSYAVPTARPLRSGFSANRPIRCSTTCLHTCNRRRAPLVNVRDPKGKAISCRSLRRGWAEL